jgi:hypothetical protein
MIVSIEALIYLGREIVIRETVEVKELNHLAVCTGMAK